MRILACEHLDSYNAKDTRREGDDPSCGSSGLWMKVTKPRTAGHLGTGTSDKPAAPGSMLVVCWMPSYCDKLQLS